MRIAIYAQGRCIEEFSSGFLLQFYALTVNGFPGVRFTFTYPRVHIRSQSDLEGEPQRAEEIRARPHVGRGRAAQREVLGVEPETDEEAGRDLPLERAADPRDQPTLRGSR